MKGTYGVYSPEERIPFEEGLDTNQLRYLVHERGFSQPKAHSISEVDTQYEMPEIPDQLQEQIQARVDEQYRVVAESD